MAAAYQSAISTSPTNLLQSLLTFLTAQGWATELSAADGTGWRLHVSKGSVYANMRAAMNERIWPKISPSGYHDYGDGGYGIGLYLGTGADTGEAWHLWPGRPVRPAEGSTIGCGMNLPAGSISGHHFFDDGEDNITVVAERAPGIFCHMGWGPALANVGNPEDFMHFFASSSQYRNTDDGALTVDRGGINISAFPPMSHGDEDYGSFGEAGNHVHSQAFVRVDAATFSGRWVGDGNYADDGYGWTGRQMGDALNLNPNSQGECNEGQFLNYRYLQGRINQAAFGGGLLMPLHANVLTDPGGRWAPIGYLPSIRWCELVGNGYSAGSVVPIGGENWMVFPHFAVRKAA